MSDGDETIEGTEAPRAEVLGARVLLLVAAVSYLAHILNSYAVQDFTEEVTRLVRKFVL